MNPNPDDIWLIEPDVERSRFLVKKWTNAVWMPVNFFALIEEAVAFVENPDVPPYRLPAC